MPGRKGILQSQNTFLDTIATRFDGIHSNFVLGNAQVAGKPIVYCSDGFCELTGFGRAQVMAKRCVCKFLFGKDTDNDEKQKIESALEDKKETKTEILLYKKNGSPFWCLLDIVPIKNEKRQVVLFLVSHKDVTRDKAIAMDIPGTDINDNAGEKAERVEENQFLDEMPENYHYQRRHSRAVLYHLSGQFEKQNKAKTKLQQLNRVGTTKMLHSISGKMPEYKVQEAKKSRYIIVHYGIFKIGWDWLILLCTFYIAIMVPFNATFQGKRRARHSMYSDVVVEILFIIDIVLNFRTSYVNKSGQVVYESRMIAMNYIKGWFLLDLLAAIPFDLLYAVQINTNTGYHIGTLIHLLKVARLLRLARLLQKLDRYSQYSVLVLTLLMSMFALAAHWMACIWFAIGKNEIEDNPMNRTVGWLYELGNRIENPIVNHTIEEVDTMTSYVTALYFTCSSLTSVGFGNVSANTNIEKIFSVCAMLAGAMMHAVIFGNVTAIIQRMYARRQNFHSRTKDLKDFFRTHHIPKTLKQRMQEYFQTMWSMNNGIDLHEILKDFPEEMRGEIGLHLNREILSLPIFESATQGCLKSITLQTRRIFCAPGEFLLHKGDAVNYIYYLCSGSMEVLKEEMVVAILGKGDLFGTDIAFEEPISISACDVRSLAYCELLCINLKGLLDALALYPEFSEKFAQEIQHDLTYNLREGHDDSSSIVTTEDEEEEESPIAPVITLPSISEDEEENTDDDDDDRKAGGFISKLQFADEDTDQSDTRDHSSSSPLLNQSDSSLHTIVPNGDLQGLSSSHPAGHGRLPRWFTTPARPHQRTDMEKEDVLPNRKPSLATAEMRFPTGGVKRYRQNRGGGGAAAKMRGGRPMPVLSQVSSQRSQEAVLVHSLQVEMEGTRNAVETLEHRIDTMSREVKTISQNVDYILKAINSLSMPSESPSPFGRHHFSYGHSPDTDASSLTAQVGSRHNSYSDSIPHCHPGRSSLSPASSVHGNSPGEVTHGGKGGNVDALSIRSLRHKRPDDALNIAAKQKLGLPFSDPNYRKNDTLHELRPSTSASKDSFQCPSETGGSTPSPGLQERRDFAEFDGKKGVASAAPPSQSEAVFNFVNELTEPKTKIFVSPEDDSLETTEL
ncbi:potassium voltage-gated channel subfamily H member 8-like isoform X1 [Haliotis rufescens]|uniref:potassium voltage-gated channel subfamily H member 8-like isoform X1 n=1 Tax=Haliotis rufescens TaxID=6454 RepID=UPI00201EA440|nr:potassium voltage-gated channel subfamily H member 8-like isoform X1 [Haliotis rufescens]